MGYYLVYENELIEIHECDKCKDHCIVHNKQTLKDKHYYKKKDDTCKNKNNGD